MCPVFYVAPCIRLAIYKGHLIGPLYSQSIVLTDKEMLPVGVEYNRHPVCAVLSLYNVPMCKGRRDIRRHTLEKIVACALIYAELYIIKSDRGVIPRNVL